MSRAKLDDRFDESESFIAALSDTIAHHLRKPSNVAWTVGIAGAVGIVFSNALFFQETAHPSAFFETRTGAAEHGLKPDEANLPISRSDDAVDKSITRIVFDSSSDAVPTPGVRPNPSQETLAAVERVETQLAVTQTGDNENVLQELQGLLAKLGFYDGEIDGLDGPKTRSAIESYKANVGLKGIQLTHEQLITSTKNNLIVTAAIPKARPDTGSQNSIADAIEQSEVKTVAYTPPTPTRVAAQPSKTILKVQAGLRAFGNESISVDGVSGAQTTQAIKEFQALFKLPVTGKIDASLISKMTDVGLID